MLPNNCLFFTGHYSNTSLIVRQREKYSNKDFQQINNLIRATYHSFGGLYVDVVSPILISSKPVIINANHSRPNSM